MSCHVFPSGVARPGPTRACALPSTSQALPSPGQQDSRDSLMTQRSRRTPMHGPAVLTQSYRIFAPFRNSWLRP